MNGGTHKVGGIAAGFVTSSLLYGSGTIMTFSIVSNYLGTGPQNVAFGIDFDFCNRSLSTVCLFGAVLGSLVSDLDKERTTASNNMPILGYIVRLFTSHRGGMHIPCIVTPLTFLFYWLTTVGVVKLQQIMINNQFTFEKIQDFFLYSYYWITKFFYWISGGQPIILCLKPFFYGLIAGIFSHIFLDTLNPKGVKLLWPIYQKPISFLNLNGSKHGALVSFVLIFGIIIGLQFKLI